MEPSPRGNVPQHGGPFENGSSLPTNRSPLGPQVDHRPRDVGITGRPVEAPIRVTRLRPINLAVAFDSAVRVGDWLTAVTDIAAVEVTPSSLVPGSGVFATTQGRGGSTELASPP
jgi:hypothetical protein